MRVLRSLSTAALLLFLAVSLTACDSGGDNGGGADLDNLSYRLSGSPGQAVGVSITYADGSGLDIDATNVTIGSDGTATGSLESGHEGVRIDASVSQGQTLTLELRSGQDVVETDADPEVQGGVATYSVEAGDVPEF